MSNPKVFEFAKEVGMTPLALMDKIREWHIPVKSHMAELDNATLELIKTKLAEAQNPTPAAAEKKPAARKKAATTAVAKPKTATKAKASVEKGAEASKPAASKKPAGAVVRRKAKTAEELKEEAAETASPVETQVEVEVAPVEVPVVVVEEAPVEAAAPVAPPPVVEEEKKPAAVAAGPARKKEVAIGNSGVASAAPKRNIVGRMDLSRVGPPPGGAPRGDRPQMGARAPMGGTPGYQGGAGGPRPKGNLRAGFVQAPVPEVMPTDDSDSFGRKRDEMRRQRGVAELANAAASVKPPTEDEQNQHFDAAEFRKREMVFQPKKKKGMLARPAQQTKITTPKASKRVVKINQTMKVGDLAMEMGIKATDIIKNLMKNGVMATVNMDLDFDTISLIVPDFGFEAVNAFKTADEIILETAFGDLNAEKVERPPVVTIMGHVDHGKTSLLDAIRNANVASGEAGGITQHIGAYQVKTETDHVITFLDTPGHEAFTSMRARGANVTDIAVIVVAADDGMMPQTQEAVNHAKAAKVPIIVAVNKMDKPGANPDKVKQQLTELELVPEEWGGTTMYVPVSALKKTGIKELLEQINLVAEVGELRANPLRSGTGIVIESKLEKGRGPVATLLIQDGTVKIGQHIVAGLTSGKVKSMINDRGEQVKEAGPGTPISLLGLNAVPQAGDKFDVVKDEKVAEQAVQVRKEIADKANQAAKKLSLEDIFSKVKQGDVKELAVVLKADVAGSLEAIQGMFSKLVTAEVKLKIVHAAVGGVTASDVLLASTAKGIVVGFNVRPDGSATNEAKRLGVDIRSYSIVYELMDEMKKAMAGLLQPDIVEKVLGHAEVRNTFNVPKVGTIAGCFVNDGKIQRSNMGRVTRDGKIIYEGKISSLKRFKDDAREVAQGFECGIGIENFNDIKVGDVIESFIKEEVAKELNLIEPNA